MFYSICSEGIIKSQKLVETIFTPLRKPIELLTHHIALDILAYFICCLPLIYIKPDIWIGSFGLGFAGLQKMEDIDDKIKRIWKHNALLITGLSLWAIINLPNAFIVANIYSALRLPMLLNRRSRLRENQQINQIVEKVFKETNISYEIIEQLTEQPNKLLNKQIKAITETAVRLSNQTVDTLTQQAVKDYRSQLKWYKLQFQIYSHDHLQELFRDRIKDKLENLFTKNIESRLDSQLIIK